MTCMSLNIKKLKCLIYSNDISIVFENTLQTVIIIVYISAGFGDILCFFIHTQESM